jgi:DNA-binding CsgD family transcriptional regulator
MQKKTVEEIERLLKGYEEGGLSRQEYCQRAGIPVTTFDYYRQRSRRKVAAQRRVVAASGLVKVKLEAAPMETQSVFSLTLSNGRRIESQWSFSDTDLARLIRIAEAV